MTLVAAIQMLLKNTTWSKWVGEDEMLQKDLQALCLGISAVLIPQKLFALLIPYKS